MQKSSLDDLTELAVVHLRTREVPEHPPREVPHLESIEEARFLKSGDEAGTAPGDRKFRPDVEGLRAIAVLLVVLYHAGVPRLTGGFVGVDVFFVISGFVITGLLLREHAAVGRNFLLAFYGRRCRRILPAASVVIVCAVLASYRWLGFLTGDETARTGRAAALFYANFHFIATGTNYLSSQEPPSVLQNYWSLSVEEQFYLVYPTLFLLAALMWRKVGVRPKLAVLLVAGSVASLAWSIHQTSVNGVAAYFSPFTRAWELALGALVAVGSLQFREASTVDCTGNDLVRIGRCSGRCGYLQQHDVLSWFGSCVACCVNGARHCRWHGSTSVGRRIPVAQSSSAMDGTTLLFAVPVALADLDHCGPACRSCSISEGESTVAVGCARSVNRFVFHYREPNQTLDLPVAFGGSEPGTRSCPCLRDSWHHCIQDCNPPMNHTIRSSP